VTPTVKDKKVPYCTVLSPYFNRILNLPLNSTCLTFIVFVAICPLFLVRSSEKDYYWINDETGAE